MAFSSSPLSPLLSSPLLTSSLCDLLQPIVRVIRHTTSRRCGAMQLSTQQLCLSERGRKGALIKPALHLSKLDLFTRTYKCSQGKRLLLRLQRGQVRKRQRIPV